MQKSGILRDFCTGPINCSSSPVYHLCPGIMDVHLFTKILRSSQLLVMVLFSFETSFELFEVDFWSPPTFEGDFEGLELESCLRSWAEFVGFEELLLSWLELLLL